MAIHYESRSPYSSKIATAIPMDVINIKVREEYYDEENKHT